MDDQRLGKDRLHKPTGLEERRVIPGMENINHDPECGVIKDGADRANENNEARDRSHRPLARFGQPVSYLLCQ